MTIPGLGWFILAPGPGRRVGWFRLRPVPGRVLELPGRNAGTDVSRNMLFVWDVADSKPELSPLAADTVGNWSLSIIGKPLPAVVTPPMRANSGPSINSDCMRTWNLGGGRGGRSFSAGIARDEVVVVIIRCGTLGRDMVRSVLDP